MIVRALPLLLLCVISNAQAPVPEITQNTQVDSAILNQWLHSGNPRLIAWASDFARRRHESEIVSEIPAILEHWSMPPIAGGYEEQAAQRRAVLSLLDTLIQENVSVPLAVIERTADEFPTQSMLLIERIPLEKSRSTLTNWALRKDGVIGEVHSHAAAMILAKNPNSSFVYSILGGTIQRVTVRILPPGMGAGGRGGAACGDSFGLPPTPNWPTVYAYGLRERIGAQSSEALKSIPVAELGDRTVVADRYEENRGSGGCRSQESESDFRYELIAYWLGLKTSQMPWKPEETLDVVWTTKAAYQREVGAFLEADRAKMSATLMKLKQRNLLDEKEIDGTFPQISLQFECYMNPCPLPDVATLP